MCSNMSLITLCKWPRGSPEQCISTALTTSRTGRRAAGRRSTRRAGQRQRATTPTELHEVVVGVGVMIGLPGNIRPDRVRELDDGVGGGAG
jgi:hypothetical protein